MKQRTVIITGANSGIGKSAAHLFAGNGNNNEIMPVSVHNSGYRKIKELFSFNYIPKYAYDKKTSDKIWELSRKIIFN